MMRRWLREERESRSALRCGSTLRKPFVLLSPPLLHITSNTWRGLLVLHRSVPVMASASSRSSTPAFLKPTRESLSDILMTLQEREQQRRLAAQRARLFRGTAATHAGGKAAQRDGKEEVDGSGGDWFSVAAGTQPDNVNKNRCAPYCAGSSYSQQCH